MAMSSTNIIRVALVFAVSVAGADLSPHSPYGSVRLFQREISMRERKREGGRLTNHIRAAADARSCFVGSGIDVDEMYIPTDELQRLFDKQNFAVAPPPPVTGSFKDCDTVLWSRPRATHGCSHMRCCGRVLTHADFVCLFLSLVCRAGGGIKRQHALCQIQGGRGAKVQVLEPVSGWQHDPQQLYGWSRCERGVLL